MESKDWHHPFEPYAIQREFMTTLFQAIEDGKVGILESPTGTGKSLSLICGALTWLREHKRKKFDESLNIENNNDDPPWMLENARMEKRRQAMQKRDAFEERLARARRKEEKLKIKTGTDEPSTKRRKTGREGAVNELEDSFMLDDYDSDDGSKPKDSTGLDLPSLGLSKETQDLMKKLGLTANRDVSTEDDVDDDEPKIFYCSRTHSQLSQFAAELRRVKFPPVLDPEAPNQKQSSPPGDSLNRSDPSQQDIVQDRHKNLVEEVKQLTLGSRKNLCINPRVNKLSSLTAINEKCMELQKPGTPADHKCTFIPNKENESLANQFRDHAVSKIRDIEDLGNLGKSMGICPYYASRPAIEISEIVTLPYPLLLQKSARDALGISLKGHVVIVDEAHNLMDSICGMHAGSISRLMILRAREQVKIYVDKFNTRLLGKNRVYLVQMLRVLDSLGSFLHVQESDVLSKDSVVPISKLLSGQGVDQINLFKLNQYINESKLARKIDGYITHVEDKKKSSIPEIGKKGRPKKATSAPVLVPVLMQIQAFLLALMNPSPEGKFILSKVEGEMTLRYILLDPTNHFKEIVEEARAVILAGGTMSPMEDYMQHLFPYLSEANISTLSCNHIIPSTNLVVFPVASRTHKKGVGGFNFSFKHRTEEGMVQRAGEALLNFILSIPDGVVVFFPSYDYLDKCVSVWRTTLMSEGLHNYLLGQLGYITTTGTIWDAITGCKPAFFEQRSNPTETTPANPNQPTGESTLAAYTECVRTAKNHRGALLLAVVNGSLSEGINFADSLGRGVVIFGLPFPNAHTIDWTAKLEYISNKAELQSLAATATAADGTGGNAIVARRAGRLAADEFYLNATMRAVNQAVGRAIRHKDDFAAILLVDERYSEEAIQAKLPAWIRGSIYHGASSGVGRVCIELKAFFADKGIRTTDEV